MKRYAYLVAGDEYSNFAKINYCVADMMLVQDTLYTYCDYESKNIECCIQYPGCGEGPEKIYSKIQKIIDSCETGDSLLFYFAGHGVKEGEKGYLILADSISSNYPDTALDLKKLNELLRNPVINGYLILDACHSEILARNALNPLFVNKMADTGCVTLASCSENEESNPYPEVGQGAFTYFLCEEIKRISIETPVLIEQLKINVCEKMLEWALVNGKKQTPTLNGQIVGNATIAVRNKNSYSGLPQIPEDILNIASPALYTKVLKKWLVENTELEINSTMTANTEWKVYGQYYVYLAYDKEHIPWIVMINVLRKENYSSVLHAFKNLLEIKKYYSRFGTKYKYYQVVIIPKGNEKKLLHTISVQSKIKKIYNSKEIMNTIVYLQAGKFNLVSTNHQGQATVGKNKFSNEQGKVL